MVLSNGTSKAKAVSTLTNQSQGGGSKKAGLPPSHNAATNIAFAMRGYQKSVEFMARTNGPTPCPSRSIGMIVNVGRMKC